MEEHRERGREAETQQVGATGKAIAIGLPVDWPASDWEAARLLVGSN